MHRGCAPGCIRMCLNHGVQSACKVPGEDAHQRAVVELLHKLLALVDTRAAIQPHVWILAFAAQLCKEVQSLQGEQNVQ